MVDEYIKEFQAKLEQMENLEEQLKALRAECETIKQELQKMKSEHNDHTWSDLELAIWYMG